MGRATNQLFHLPLGFLTNPKSLGLLIDENSKLNEAELAVLVENCGAFLPDLLIPLRIVQLELLQAQTADVYLSAKEKLIGLINGIEEGQWPKVMERMTRTLSQPSFQRFYSTGRGEMLHALTEAKYKQRKAVGKITAQALLEAPQAYQNLQAVAGGEGEQALMAQEMLRLFERLKPLATLKNALALAQATAKFVDEVYREVLVLLSTPTIPQNDLLRRRLIVLSWGLETTIEGLLEIKAGDPAWQTHPKTGAILHDKVDRPLLQIRVMGDRLKDGPVTIDVDERVHSKRRQEREIYRTINYAHLNNELMAEAKGVTIVNTVRQHFSLKDEAQAEMLEDNLTELIHNAIKYGAKKIKIDWDPVRKCLIVSDDGIGIRHPERIFDGDYREAPETAPGSGRGLKFVKERFEAFSWKIEVASTVGQGTTFTLTPSVDAIEYSKSYRGQ